MKVLLALFGVHLASESSKNPSLGSILLLVGLLVAVVFLAAYITNTVKK